MSPQWEQIPKPVEKVKMTLSISPLVSVDWLAQHWQDPAVRIADVRWYLPHLGKSGRAEYEAGHIPGAVYVDLETELSSPKGQGPGRHPLPTTAIFEAAMRRIGVSADTLVVAYDDGGGTAARLWWLLRYFGHAKAAVLDGGIGAWRASGQPVERDGEAKYAAGTFAGRPNPTMIVDKTIVGRLAQNPSAAVIDARAAERYEGKLEPIDARAGHIPGAVSAPFGGNLGPDGRFLTPDALKAKYDALGVGEADTVVMYCGSGVTACHNVLAVHLSGRTDVKLYPGSWSDWSADPTLPAATGPQP